MGNNIEEIITTLYEMVQDAWSLPLGAEKCVLERDNGNGTWLVSESALNGYEFRATHSIQSDGTYGYGNYIFQGFIYIPWTEGGNFKWWMARKLLYKRKGLIL